MTYHRPRKPEEGSAGLFPPEPLKPWQGGSADPRELARRSRTDDADTAVHAGEAIGEHAEKVKVRVLEAIRELGPMDGRTAERLPRFRGCGTTTVRKRLSELAHPDREGGPALVSVERTAGGFPCNVYELVELEALERPRYVLEAWTGAPRRVTVDADQHGELVFRVSEYRDALEPDDLAAVFQAALEDHDKGSDR